jgi:hypothetical protein
MKRNYDGSLRRTRVNLIVLTIRGRNLTLINAINGCGIVYFKFFDWYRLCRINQMAG